ncbi:spermidine synthase [Flavobacterium silvaticum]|uniref:Spermidine synthase n=1 Tax=Flavobacterium silvaticum TaxID=1852020 RepID=A0A972FN21_9FLAO|nr:fused MFS/spermidine synthase [Flavobacterium silvaticum]NMH29079.1 spermidine synthase [Flavobacterium silvaticum]
MIRRLLSFFLPITIVRRKSDYSKDLEVSWANGELVLDSRNTNYSYGSLQRVLRRGLKEIGFEKVARMHKILVLGVAGGSVIKTLVHEIKTTALITGVEIDAAVIELANSYFGLDKIPNVKIVIDDAFEFVLKTKELYDLVIIDVFQDTTMPNFLFEKFFAMRIAAILTPDGYILFNTMTLNGEHDSRNEAYVQHFSDGPFRVKLIPRIEHHNELIVVHKTG